MIWDEGDANPLHRRIPGEVVSRRRQPEKKKPVPEKELEEVVVDLRAAIVLKPDARLKWLAKACKMVSDGQSTANDLYDVVVSRKFVSGVPERVVRRFNAVLVESMDIFSEKQQRYLTSNDCPIMARLALREAFLDPNADDLADVVPGEFEEVKPESSPPPEPKVAAAAAPPAPGAGAPLPASGGRAAAAPGAGWQTVKDEWTMRRQEASAKEEAKRQEELKDERAQAKKKEEEAASRRAAEAEAEKRRKLEEEADALFSLSVSAPPAPLMSATSGGGDTGDRDRDRDRDRKRRHSSLSRSRSISSRTARRIARQNKAERITNSRASWRQERASEAAGSRAIFMNRDFVEDLPHMARPQVSGIRGVGGRREKSRSRERRRR